MRSIGVVTVARSDYGIYLPLLRRIQDEPELKLQLLVSGMHLSPEFGMTVRQIESDGFEISQRIESMLSSDAPEGISKSVGLGVIGFAQAYAQSRPDILVVLGDRFEMYAAVVAALPFLLPVAHIAGGAVTTGAIDDSIRHSITKMSHIHFVETETYANRVKHMGEDPRRVFTTGAMALDNLQNFVFMSLDELNSAFGFSLCEAPLLVTFHPVTREYEMTESYTQQMLAALARFDVPIVFTYPNADTMGRVIIRMISEFVSKRSSRCFFVENLGMKAYFSLMKHALAMVGNSSSGLVESPSFKLPVVNIGNRQRGRIAAANVIQVGYSEDEIARGTDRAISAGFRQQLSELVNPYGDGHASERMIDALKSASLDSALLTKEFCDYPAVS